MIINYIFFSEVQVDMLVEPITTNVEPINISASHLSTSNAFLDIDLISLSKNNKGKVAAFKCIFVKPSLSKEEFLW